MKYLIANWKAQTTLSEMIEWIETFRELFKEEHAVKKKLDNQTLSIIIAPPFPFLLYVKNRFQDILGIEVAGQNVSQFKEGKYTGEVTAKALKDAAEYTIVGHSERREYFNEKEEDIERKISHCNQFGISPILCVRNERDRIYERVSILAFEPVEAIGTGDNADVSYVLEMKKKMNIPAETAFLYGGSAESTNILEYLNTGEIDGFLVGTASLDPREFFAMAKEI